MQPAGEKEPKPSPTLPTPVMSELRVGVVGGLLAAIGSMSMALYTPAMPEIVHAFGTTEAMVKLTLSIYFAGFCFAQLFGARKPGKPELDAWRRILLTLRGVP